MGKRFDIISAGLIVYDIIASPVEKDIFSVDTKPLESISYKTGGDALNVAVNASRLGARVCLGGIVGDDAPGKFLTESAQKEGIDTSGVLVSAENRTSVSIVLCEPDGQRHFAYYGKSNNEFDGTSISDELLGETGILYIGSVMGLRGLEGGKLKDLFMRAKARRVMTAMDSTWATDGIWLPRIREALPYCDIFIPSFDEAREICGTSDPKEIVSFIHSFGVRIAGVKLGKSGVLVEDIEIPAFNCERVVDTTGAGDAFMGGFVTGISMGKSVYDSALLGSAASNCCIREIGAVTGAPDLFRAEKVVSEFLDGTLR